MTPVLISACLAGDRVRYDGRQKPLAAKILKEWNRKCFLVKVCPEVSGGLKTPRPPAQILGGNGLDVLKGKARVVDINGHDVTRSFVRGAEYALSLAEKWDIKTVILKEKSPSCGVHHIYDGSFSGTLVPGFGVTAAILQVNRIKVFTENDLDQLERILFLH